MLTCAKAKYSEGRLGVAIARTGEAWRWNCLDSNSSGNDRIGVRGDARAKHDIGLTGNGVERNGAEKPRKWIEMH